MCMWQENSSRINRAGLTSVSCGLPCGKKLKNVVFIFVKSLATWTQDNAKMLPSPLLTALRPERKQSANTAALTHAMPLTLARRILLPCQAKTFITCACQNQKKQAVKCLASKTSPGNTTKTLDCNEECLRLKRNASPRLCLEHRPGNISRRPYPPYSSTTLSFFTA